MPLLLPDFTLFIVMQKALSAHLLQFHLKATGYFLIVLFTRS